MALSAPIAALLKHFHARKPARIWSLIVTLYGDAIVPRGGSLWIGSLIEIMALFRIDAGHVRTAVSRLSSDGWLASTKRGRASYYRLTKSGEAEFLQATQRIYSGVPVQHGALRVAVIGPEAANAACLRSELKSAGYAALAPAVHAGLAEHLIRALIEADFDIAASKCLREGEGEGHAMAYVHRHVLDPARPLPVVPVFLNTYYEPNRPSPRRCYRLGQAIRSAVESFPGAGRVGVLASGGLSHFLVDEDLDRAILKALADKDAAFLQNLPWNKLHSGSSEILNWVALAGAVEALDMTWFEYVPGYRTPAGTGTGLSFATWA